MTSKIIGKILGAREYYSDHSMRSLFGTGCQVIARKTKSQIVQRRSISQSGLRLMCSRNNSIWYGKPETPLEIDEVEDETLKRAFEGYPRRFGPERPFVCELENCLLIGPGAVGLSEDDRLIRETVSEDSPRRSSLGELEGDFYKRLLRTGSKVKDNSDEAYLLPLVSEYKSYYHWMTEYLPKLRMLELYSRETGRDPTVLIESEPREFIKETLSSVGYDSDQYVEWDGGQMRVENLIIPIHRTRRFDYQKPEHSNYNPSYDDLNWLRNRILSNTSTEGSSGRKIIYISRQGASPIRGRKVLNYNQLLDILEEYGVESYALETLPFEEQVRIFADADVIIGPHGAGLFNMIFSDDPVVVELFPESILKPHFYYIANMMGYEYVPLVTQSEDNSLIIDEDKFRKVIETTLKIKN